LAAAAADAPTSPRTHPVEQVPQWLFALDPAGLAAFRALALLAGHPAEQRAVADAPADPDPSRPHDLPPLRAAAHESVRLWPTTPAILRETTPTTRLGERVLPAKTLVVVLTPSFHRDDERLPYADRFAPAIWQDGSARESLSLVPF